MPVDSCVATIEWIAYISIGCARPKQCVGGWRTEYRQQCESNRERIQMIRRIRRFCVWILRHTVRVTLDQVCTLSAYGVCYFVLPVVAARLPPPGYAALLLLLIPLLIGPRLDRRLRAGRRLADSLNFRARN